MVSPNSKCPTCGHDIPPSELLIDLDKNQITINGKTIRLTPRQTELMHVLHESSPSVVTNEKIQQLLLGKNTEIYASADINNVKVLVSKLRVTLHRAKFPLKIRTAWGHGYYLETMK